MDNIEKFIEYKKITTELAQAFKEEQLRRKNKDILWNLREVKPEELEQYVDQMYNNEEGYDDMYDDNYKGVK